MGYAWTQEFEDGETRAACSKCGVPYRYPSELARQNDGMFYCKRRCLEQTVLTRDRIQAQSRKRREAPPPKFVQPPAYAEDYFDAEAAAMAKVVHDLSTSTDPTVIGWGVRYLADMVIENRRPEASIIRAKAVIANRCNYLLTLQYGAPAGPAPTVTVERLRYGGFADGSNLYTSITVIAGAAFLKAYSIFGTSSYLDAAVRCAHFLRHMQCQDIDNNGQGSTYDGSTYHIGGFAECVSASSTITWTDRYNVFDVAAVWFLDMLADVQGGSTQYGSASSADFTASTVASLDTMIEEAVAFVVTGAKDSSFEGAYKSGLSTTYPRSYYANQDATALGGAGTWIFALSADGGDVIRGEEIALALFALNEAGEAADTVTAVFDWLMAFAANPLNVPPAEDDQLLIGNLKGAYDPKVAIATELDVSPAQDHEGAGYSWLAAGLLAPIASVRYPTQFAAAKANLGVPNPSARGAAPCYRYIGETGYSGLSLQFSEALP